MSRPRGFVLRGQRETRAYPQEVQGFATFSMLVKPLFQCRARHGLFTCVALGRPVSSPNSRPSLCLKRPGLRGVALALSVATYPGWQRRGESNTKFSDRESWRFLEHKCSASCSWAALSGIGCRPKPKKPHGAFASVRRHQYRRWRGGVWRQTPSGARRRSPPPDSQRDGFEATLPRVGWGT